MKIENVKNNINGSTYSSTPTTKINMLRVRVDDHIDPNKRNRGITLIAFAISRKCVRYEERAWKPCERREKERKV